MQFTVPVSIVPGFGCNILPECLFLSKGFAVNKNGEVATVKTQDGKTLMYARAKQHDESWLFYTELRTDGNAVDPPPGEVFQATGDGEFEKATGPLDVHYTHAMACAEGEQEKLLFSGFETVLATSSKPAD